MGVRHRDYPIHGVQFHPESILTRHGKDLLKNFLRLIWMGLWLTVDFYHSLKPWQMGFYFGLGFFWAFHMTFTASMLHPRQSDLSREGYIFSTVIIALFNFFAVLLLLALLIHDFPRALSLFGRHVEVCYVIGATHSWTWMRKVTTALLSR
jgi:hypothetical protein